jgi:peptide/nickel transport system substrate-binding protein
MKNPTSLIYATVGDAQTMDPAWSYDMASAQVILNVYEPLLFPKKERPDEFVPMLATKWDISPNGKTYTFTIRKGVKFHAGQDLTPEDVAYSFWRGLIQDRAGGPQWILIQPFFGLTTQSFANDVVKGQHNGDWAAACTAVQQAITYDNAAGTVTMHLQQPYGPMLQILSGTWASVVSKPWVIAQKGWDGQCATAEKYHDPKVEDDELTKSANGTGPYKLDRWAPGEEIDLARNDAYWLQQPLWEGGPAGPARIERVVIKLVEEWGTRFTTFKAGDADIAEVPRQNIAQVDPLVRETCPAGAACQTTNPNGFLRLYTNLPLAQAEQVIMNQQINTTGGNPKIGSGALDGNGIPPDFFADLHIRKAFNACFDWKTYIDQVYHGEAAQTFGPILAGMPGYEAGQAHYAYNPEQCAAEFKAAGVKGADGKSVWDTGFSVQYVYLTGTEEWRVAGEILKNNLQQVNPKFKLDLVDEQWPALLQDLNDSRLALVAINWIQDFNDPHDWALPYLGSGGAWAPTQNASKELLAQFDQMIAQAVQTTERSARAKIYAQLQNMAYEQALNIYLVQPQGRRYVQSWVQGWYFNPAFAGIYFYPLSKGQ